MSDLNMLVKGLSFLLHLALITLYTSTCAYGKFDIDRITRQLDTIKQHACDGEMFNISCPLGTIITIKFAQYGRQVPSSQMCPSKSWRERHKYSYHGYNIQEDINCIAKTSLQVLLDKCEKLHQCQLVAGAETFQQDPCPQTSKYLEVHYQCRPNEFTSESVCEGEQMKLWCKKSTRIAIYSAMFGRTPNDTSLCESNKQGFINCKAENVLEEVTKQCHGRKQCSIEAAEYIFGNPCPSGIRKYLNITYLCVPKKLLKKLRRRRKKKKHKTTTTTTTTTTTISSINIIFTKPSTTPSIYYKPTPRPELVPADAAETGLKEISINNHVTYEKEKTEKKGEEGEITSTESTVICMNVTGKVAVGNNRNGPMGLLQDLFNAWYFLQENQEKAILYFVIGVCFGIIVLLTVMLIKIGADYKRNMRAKLDVTEPTHSHNVMLNHNSLEMPMLDGSDSLDRIEVVRFSPRGTLRNNDPGNRSLSNYYG